MRPALSALALLATFPLALPVAGHAETAGGALPAAPLAFAGEGFTPAGDAELGAVTAGTGAVLGFALDQPQLALADPWLDHRDARFRAASPREESVASILEKIAALVELGSTSGVGIMTGDSQGQIRFEQFETRTIQLPGRELSINR